MGQTCSSCLDTGISEESLVSTFGGMASGKNTKDADRVKILLMGAGNVGKTTILKQFKLKYGNGFTDSERILYRDIIMKSYIHSIQKLTFAVDDFITNKTLALADGRKKRKYSNRSRAIANAIKDIPKTTGLHEKLNVQLNEDEVCTMVVRDALMELWKEPVVRLAFKHSSLITALEEPIGYLMYHIERISEPDYIPSDEDILNVRTATEDVETFDFDYTMGSEHRASRIVDVGGQRYFRGQWISEFENAHAVLFVVGLDGFDQTLVEDNKTNRIAESLELFRDLCSSPYLTKVSFILALNKVDKFKARWKRLQELKAKNPKSELLNTFFSKDSKITLDNTYKDAIDYLSDRFMRIHKQEVAKAANLRESVALMGELEKPTVYPFNTCATDIDSMSNFIFSSMKTILIIKNIAANF